MAVPVPSPAGEPWPSPERARERVAILRDRRERVEREIERNDRVVGEARAGRALAAEVEAALETLQRDLFRRVLDTMEEKLSSALSDVLGRPLAFRATLDWSRGQTAVDFHLERDGLVEDPYHGQGGSVANVLSVGLRLFSLTTLDPSRHRRFLVLDEQDCWLQPGRVPALARMVAEAGRALGFQVVLISHHDRSVFERFADRVYEFIPQPDGTVRVEESDPSPTQDDGPAAVE